MNRIVWMVMLIASVMSCRPKPEAAKKVSEVPEVLIHYMTWYSDESSAMDSLRHWQYGHANTPIIGRYDSHDKAAIYYHLLLASAAGIDGVVVNVKDEYDRIGLEKVLESIKELDSISQHGFDFSFAVSYDDQGFDLETPLDTTQAKLQYFKINYVDNNKHYLKFNQKPVFYSFDYPNKFITAKGLKQSLDSAYGEDQSLLIWNTFGEGENTQDYVDAFYPWVQPGGDWMEDGSNWGKPYLDYFYSQINQFQNKSYDFCGGGVWAGFDDRKNTSWGGNRLISRSGGATYDSTWMYIQNYQGEIPMKYVMIETWNDWNEGTEIEPSFENGYQNLSQTEARINELKGLTAAPGQTKFELATSIYETLKKGGQEPLRNEEVIKSIQYFLNKEYDRVEEILKSLQ